MANTNHGDITGTNVHTPITWTYANSTAREAATGFVAGDVGKFARQSDDNSIWVLSDDDPATWVQVGGSAALADHDHSGDAGDGGTFDAANLTSGAASDGDVLTADGSGGAAWEAPAGGASGYYGTQISRTLVGAGGVANFDVSSIAADYDYLEIIFEGQGSADASLLLTVNNDTGANYALATLYGGSASGGAVDTTREVGVVRSANPSCWRIIVPNYSNTTLKKVYHSSGFYYNGDASRYERSYGTRWDSTAAINRITLAPASGSFAEGSLFVLVGYKNH